MFAFVCGERRKKERNVLVEGYWKELIWIFLATVMAECSSELFKRSVSGLLREGKCHHADYLLYPLVVMWPNQTVVKPERARFGIFASMTRNWTRVCVRCWKAQPLTLTLVIVVCVAMKPSNQPKTVPKENAHKLLCRAVREKSPGKTDKSKKKIVEV